MVAVAHVRDTSTRMFAVLLSIMALSHIRKGNGKHQHGAQDGAS